MLTRIYGTAFAKQEELDAYLKQIEEAEKRDHRKLGREMDLFHFQEEGPGVGVLAPQRLDAVPGARSPTCAAACADGYVEVNAPQLLDKSLWETSGHWDGIARTCSLRPAGEETEDERVFAIKPMNCPGHVQIFKHGLK